METASNMDIGVVSAITTKISEIIFYKKTKYFVAKI